MSRKTRPMNILAVLYAAAALFSTVARAADVPASAQDRAKREAQLIETLQGDASGEEKDKACRELQVIGTPACVPALAALLPNKDLSHIARYALEPMPYPEVGQALREALAKTTGITKVGVIGSLGFREDKEAVPELVRLLKDPDAEVAGAAAAALGRIGTPEAARALGAFRTDAPESLRTVAAEASLAAAERLLRQGRQEDAARIYETLQAPEWPRHVRLGAFVGLLTARPGEAPDRVVRAITGDDPILGSVAVANVTALKDKDPATGATVAERLASELPKASDEVQALLIGALADCGEASALPAVVKAAAGPNPEVRLAAVKALGKIGDATSVETLSKTVVEGKSDAEKEAAANSLERLRGEGVNAALLACMKATPADARPALIDALVARNATDAASGLLQEAAGPDAQVRAAAFKALGRLAGPNDLPVLLKLLVELQGDAGRGEAERAVVQVSRKIADESARADAALMALQATGATSAKCSLLRVLGGIAGAEAFDAVRRALKDEAPEVRDAAVRALADWPDDQALDALLGELRTTDSPTHRVLILRGCVRLLGLGTRPATERLTIHEELMKAAQRPEDRKLVLAGLADVADPAALKMVEPCLEDPEIKVEAERAMLKIASGIAGSAPAAAKETASKLRAESGSEEVRKEAARIIEQIEQFEDFIVAWQVAGPYAEAGRNGAQLFDVVFPPEKSGQDAKWRNLPASRADKPWMLDLAFALGGEQRVAYARTWVHSEGAQPARLEMGVDDGVKAWLNGEVVHANNSGGAAIPGEEKANVSLKQGWNSLMLKITQDTGPWEFCARLRAPDGARLEGVRVDAAHEGPVGMLPASPQAKAAAPGKPGTPKAETGAVVPVTGWTPLFNGKDLTGWRPTGEAVFKVEDGCLVGTQTTGKGGDLWTEGEWDDFELRVTYRVVWPANSGFWFRHNGQTGYQFDVLKWPNHVAYSGTLYCPEKMFLITNLNESLENRDGWNQARVLALGDELTLWLNDAQIGQCRDDLVRKGKIGVQVHGGDGFKGMQIIIKKMEIRGVKR